MASVNQTRLHCVNQMGKTHSKPLAARDVRGTACQGHGMSGARHGRGTAWARRGRGMGAAWARHAMCESASRVTPWEYNYVQRGMCKSYPRLRYRSLVTARQLLIQGPLTLPKGKFCSSKGNVPVALFREI